MTVTDCKGVGDRGFPDSLVFLDAGVCSNGGFVIVFTPELVAMAAGGDACCSLEMFGYLAVPNTIDDLLRPPVMKGMWTLAGKEPIFPSSIDLSREPVGMFSDEARSL